MKTVKIVKLLFLLLLASMQAWSQKITSVPSTPTIEELVTVRFDIAQCTRQDLIDFTGDVYVHTGVKITSSTSWEYVVAGWGENIPKAKCTRISANVYEIALSPSPKLYYGVAEEDTVLQLAFVVRSADGTKQSEDLFLNIYQPGLTVELINPASNIIVAVGEEIEIDAQTVALGTPEVDSIVLYIDNSISHISKYDTLSTSLTATGPGKHWLKVVADNPEFSVSDSLYYFVIDDINVSELPGGVTYGINYIDDNTVTLVLLAPHKEAIFVIGDFNNWEPDNSYLMNRTANDSTWWLTISGLNAGEEYAFQYLIDGNIYVTDPYTEKVLDPWNDEYISSATYPGLKEYPTGKTSNIVGIIQTAQPEYVWPETDFTMPASTDMIIYEIHIQNFTEAANIKTLTDTLDYLEQLGINTIELMPVNEFEGNISWGYNPSFYFALDKTYGTKNDFKDFVAECHSRGIAVIIDMVLNHSYSQSPLVQMYWDGSSVTAQSPWYNITCPHSNWCWGYDFDHESKATQYFVDRVTNYWLTEYQVDGFRFDFTKGFTNTVDANAWGPDASRIAILKRIADRIWEVKPEAKVIFEHLAENSEEKSLAEHGILLWGNMNYNYNEGTMGYTESNKSDLSWAFYSQRGWDVPGVVAYMESHDEERLMYKNIQYGASNSQYDVKILETGLRRVETAAAFFFTIPGPKMIWEWGELGYDFSINRCSDGTVNDNCRLTLKPIRWDYYEDEDRHRLYRVFEALIDFKKSGFCNTDDFSYNVTGSLKTIHLNTESNAATIIGNFGITEANINPAFQHTGTWYDYMTGESIEISNTSAEISLKPGEYHIYTDILLDVPIGIKENKVVSDKNFKVFPNPVTGNQVFVHYSLNFNETIKINLYSTTGLLLQSEDYKVDRDGLISLDLEGYSSQVLLYEIITGNNKITGKLIIN